MGDLLGPEFKETIITELGGRSRKVFIDTSQFPFGGSSDASDEEIKAAYERNPDTNEFDDAEKVKLAGIEGGATADQSASQIKTLYESNANTNEFSDGEETKLAGIETAATADQTGAEIKTLYEAEADTNAFTDAEQTKLAGIEALAEVNTVDSVNAQTGTVVLDADDVSDAATTNKYTTAAEITKLAGIETAATADQTAGEIKTAYESNANTNEYDDAEQTKLAGIETAATADQTAGEIKTAYESNANTNEYDDAEQTKLAGIASGAQVNTVDSVNTQTGAVVLDADDISDAATTNKFTTAAEISKLAGIEASATADQSNAEIKTAYEANANTNEFSDAEQTKLAGIEALAEVNTVDSVNAQTGVVVLDADDISDAATTNKFTTAAEITKLAGIETAATVDQTGAEIKTAYEGESNTNAYTDADETTVGHITVTQAVNLDTIESDTTTNNAKLTYPAADATKVGFISITQAVNLDTVESDTATNNAKVTNATHTGEVTGATALTLDVTAISNQTLAIAGATDMILIEDATDGTLKRVDASDFLGGGAPVDSVNTQTGVVVLTTDDISDLFDTNKFTTAAEITKLAGIETAATADQSGAQIKTLYEGNANTNEFSDAEQTKLAGIETAATADQTNGEIKTAYEANADTNEFSDAEQTKLAGIETAADVTDETNVLSSLDGATIPTAISAGGDKVIFQDITDSDNIKTDTCVGVVLAANGIRENTSNLTPSAWFLDEDDMSSDDATKTSSQQAIKAFVEASIPPNIILRDEKSAGTHGGSFTAGTRVRDLNTEVRDINGDNSLSSDQFTLTAGDWYIRASAPAYQTNRHRIFLYNATGAVDLLIGTSEQDSAGSDTLTRSFVHGVFTIAASQALEIRDIGSTTSNTLGFGVAANDGKVEVYTVVELWGPF